LLVLMASVGSTAGRVAARLLRAIGDRSGGPLMETMVALSVFVAVGTGVLVGVQTIQNSGNRIEGKAVAENLARNQMEHVFNVAYQNATSTYASIADVPCRRRLTLFPRPLVAGLAPSCLRP